MTTSLILVLNCGSSSVKFAVVDPRSEQQYLTGVVEKIGSSEALLTWKKSEQKVQQSLGMSDYHHSIAEIVQLIHNQPELEQQLAGIGHRVVHGGEAFSQSVLITNNVLDAIREHSRLAPLHNPANIQGIEAMARHYPQLPQGAVFDTAFHHSLPERAYLYPIPYELYEKYRIRRYGFHGISHRYVSQQAAKLLNKKIQQLNLITAHLGNGCSITAIKQGKSIDTSMGLTPLEGLMMGTRSGDIDPGLHEYLCQQCNYTISEVNQLLNKQSGLLGISGISMDMRTLTTEQENNPRARLAIQMFCYRLAKYIAAMTVPLGTLDALVFTGGIGENAAYIRASVLQQLEILNFICDDTHNQTHGIYNQHIITTDSSRTALVIPTNEELLIAQDTLQVIGAKQ